MSAPSFHHLRTPLSTSITVNKPYEEVVSSIVDAITNLGIGHQKTPACVYSCTQLMQNDLLRFEIRIYLNEDKTHLIEFKQLSGDRFSYAETLTHLGFQLGTPIPGARLYRTNDEVDFSNMENHHNFIATSIEDRSSRDQQVQGMQTIAALARDFSKSTDPRASEYFSAEGLDLVKRVIEITKASIETDQVMCLIGVSVLADIMKVAAGWSKEMLTAVSNLARDARAIKGDLAVHFLAESRKLMPEELDV